MSERANSPRDPLTRFDSVDASEAADDFIRCLNSQDALPEIVRWREKSYQMLGLEQRVNVVDVGCGTGTALAEMASVARPGTRLRGVDLSDAMVQEARKRLGGTGVEITNADAATLPFPDDDVDGYRAERLYQHLEDQPAALREARRVLRSGGRIVIADGEPDSVAMNGSDRELTRAVIAAYRDSVQDGWVGRRLPEMLTDAGFVDIEVDVGVIAATDFHTYGFYVEMFADVATKTEAITPPEARRWLEDQHERGRAGRWFLALPMYTVSARCA